MLHSGTICTFDKGQSLYYLASNNFHINIQGLNDHLSDQISHFLLKTVIHWVNWRVILKFIFPYILLISVDYNSICLFITTVKIVLLNKLYTSCNNVNRQLKRVAGLIHRWVSRCPEQNPAWTNYYHQLVDNHRPNR